MPLKNSLVNQFPFLAGHVYNLNHIVSGEDQKQYEGNVSRSLVEHSAAYLDYDRDEEEVAFYSLNDAGREVLEAWRILDEFTTRQAIEAGGPFPIAEPSLKERLRDIEAANVSRYPNHTQVESCHGVHNSLEDMMDCPECSGA